MATATSNKSDAIRKIIAKHPSAPLRDIQAALKEQGIKASDALVNKIKYGRGQSQPGRGRRRGNTKAEAIRQAWNKLGRDSRPRDVVAHLAARKIKVSPAQVSTLRVQRNRTSGAVSFDDLVAAKDFVSRMGSIASAQQVLNNLAKLL